METFIINGARRKGSPRRKCEVYVRLDLKELDLTKVMASSLCSFKSIIVCNGAIIPVSHIGQAFLSYSNNKFSLKMF